MLAVSASEPPFTWSNAALITICDNFVTVRSIGLDLGFRGDLISRRSILIAVGAKRFDTGALEVGIEPGDLGLTLCLLRVRETVGKPTQALVHIANQQNSRYGHQHDHEQPHRLGKPTRPGVPKVVDREIDVHNLRVRPRSAGLTDPVITVNPISGNGPRSPR